MRRAYRIIAFIIAAEVVIQAAAIAWMISGLGRWVQEGGVLDKATMEEEGGPLPFPELVGIIVHGMNGQFLIPLFALALLVIAFFARVPKGVTIAAILFGLVVVQVLLGLAAHGVGMPALGLIHGANALLIFSTALLAAHRARAVRPVAEHSAVTDAHG